MVYRTQKIPTIRQVNQGAQQIGFLLDPLVELGAQQTGFLSSPPFLPDDGSRIQLSKRRDFIN
jgi:hypothetical protein